MLTIKMQVKTLDLYLEMLVSKHCSYFYRTNKSGQTVRLRKSSLVRVFTEGNVKFGESVCLLLEKIQLFYTKRKKKHQVAQLDCRGDNITRKNLGSLG